MGNVTVLRGRGCACWLPRPTERRSILARSRNRNFDEPGTRERQIKHEANPALESSGATPSSYQVLGKAIAVWPKTCEGVVRSQRLKNVELLAQPQSARKIEASRSMIPNRWILSPEPQCSARALG